MYLYQKFSTSGTCTTSDALWEVLGGMYGTHCLAIQQLWKLPGAIEGSAQWAELQHIFCVCLKNTFLTILNLLPALEFLVDVSKPRNNWQCHYYQLILVIFPWRMEQVYKKWVSGVEKC